MLKMVGIVCILAGCAGWGMNRVMDEQSRIRHLRESLRVIRRIQDEVSYGKHTLPEICLILSECADEHYQDCFKKIYEQTNQTNGISFGKAWEREMDLCLKNVPLTEDEKGIWKNLPDNLGMQEEKFQAAGFGQSMDLLSRKCREAEDAYENRSRMIFSVSVLMGVFLTILLI